MADLEEKKHNKQPATNNQTQASSMETEKAKKSQRSSVLCVQQLNGMTINILF